MSPSSSRKVHHVRIVILVGNPKPQSRTLHLARTVAERIALVTGATITREIDLADYADDLFRWPHEGLSELNEAVASTDILVIATPTYKAAYTGLLKAFLDRYASNALAGVVAIPVMTAGDPLQGMVVETTLRPLLVELGASVPVKGLFFLMSQMDELDQVVDKWILGHRRCIESIRPLGAADGA